MPSANGNWRDWAFPFVLSTLKVNQMSCCSNEQGRLVRLIHEETALIEIMESHLVEILWMDEILHHLESMGTRCLLAVAREPSFQGFLGGAGFRPSTVGP